VVGAWYENDANGDIYEKTGASTWTLRDNLTGPTGATGAAGTNMTSPTVFYATTQPVALAVGDVWIQL
jgi:hypothetical protein